MMKNAPTVERWVVSDRVLVGAGAAERPLALGLSAGRIVARVDAAELRARGLPHVLDFGRRPVAPAFVNGHVHLAMSPLRGITDAENRLGNVVTDVFFRVESQLSEADVEAFTRLGAFESLLSGTGEVWDHYYFGDAVARALSEVGLGAVVAPTLQDLGGPFPERHERELEATLRIHQSAKYASAGVFAAVGPHASDTVSDGLFERARALAEAIDAPLHFHLAQALSEMPERPEALRSRLLGLCGRRPVLAVHASYASRADVEAYVGAGWVLGVCPLSQIQFAFPGPAAEWLGAGGRIAVGTDTVASNDALSVQRELPWFGGWGALASGFGPARQKYLGSGERAALLELENERVERVAATDSSTRALLALAFGQGLPAIAGAPRGTLDIGAMAHLQVLEPDAPELFPDDDWPRSLAYGDTRGAIHALIVAGKLIGTPGEFRRSLLTSRHYLDALDEARRRKRELWTRAGLG